jgi:hypothetical protein
MRLRRLFLFEVVFGVFAPLASKQPKHGEAFLILANMRCPCKDVWLTFFMLIRPREIDFLH